jgi:septal ring factor EnvC (AmiA/AmiB activator)
LARPGLSIVLLLLSGATFLSEPCAEVPPGDDETSRLEQVRERIRELQTRIGETRDQHREVDERLRETEREISRVAVRLD